MSNFGMFKRSENFTTDPVDTNIGYTTGTSTDYKILNISRRNTNFIYEIEAINFWETIFIGGAERKFYMR